VAASLNITVEECDKAMEGIVEANARRMTSKSLLSSPVILYAAISSVNRGTASG
jgi:hypothetical protein